MVKYIRATDYHEHDKMTVAERKKLSDERHKEMLRQQKKNQDESRKLLQELIDKSINSWDYLGTTIYELPSGYFADISKDVRTVDLIQAEAPEDIYRRINEQS